MRARDAETVGALMAEADLQGSDGHGAIRLPQYVKRIKAGGVNLSPNIRVERERAVKAKAARGEMMPEGWMVDRAGKPLTDPKRADEGFLLPIGGYKGYGLALVVGLIAGTLNGAAMGKDLVDFNRDAGAATDTGQAIVAIDPAAFGDLAHFKREVDRLIRDLRASERMPGV